MDEYNDCGEFTPPAPEPVPELRPEPASLPLPEVKRRFSGIGWALVLMVILQQLGQGVLMVAAQMFDKALQQSPWFLICLIFLPLYGLGFPVLLAVMRRLPSLPAPAVRRLRPAQLAQLALASLAAAYALNYCSVWLNRLIGNLKGGEVSNPLEQLISGDSSPWAVLLFVVLLAPVFEEFVFRWLLYKKLAAFGAKTYILFSATVFALYHMNFYQMFYAFALGLVLAGLAYYTGNIKASIALHLTVNLVGSGAPLLLSSSFLSEGRLPTLAFRGALILIGALGVLSAALLASRRRELSMPAGIYRPPEGKTVFGNAGMAVLLVVLAAMTVLTVML